MRLEQEDILFIDRYLEKEGVAYADIRYEMVDHIASAIEEKMEVQQASFHYAFKAYMAANKKAIMKNNNGRSFLSFTEVKRFVGFLLKPQMLLVLVIFLGVNYFLKDLSIVEENQKYFKISIFYGIGIIGILQLLFFRVILKKRFYYVEKTGQLLGLIYWLNFFVIFPTSKMTSVNSYYYMLVIYILVGYVSFSVHQIRSFYHLKMNRI